MNLFQKKSTVCAVVNFVVFVGVSVRLVWGSGVVVAYFVHFFCTFSTVDYLIVWFLSEVCIVCCTNRSAYTVLPSTSCRGHQRKQHLRRRKRRKAMKTTRKSKRWEHGVQCMCSVSVLVWSVSVSILWFLFIRLWSFGALLPRWLSLHTILFHGLSVPQKQRHQRENKRAIKF